MNFLLSRPSREKGVAAPLETSYAYDADGALRKADRSLEPQGDGAELDPAQPPASLDVEDDEEGF